MAIEKYDRDGTLVYVTTELKSQEADYSMCKTCVRHIEDEFICPIVRDVERLSKVHDITLPIWECPVFVDVTYDVTSSDPRGTDTEEANRYEAALQAQLAAEAAA